MNEVAEFPFHKGAKGALYVVAVLLIVLVVTIPVAIYCFFRIGKAKVTISRTGVRAEGLILTDSFEFADVARLGLLKVQLAARGLGGALANAKLGGLGYGMNVVVETRSGKTIKFISNQYERHEELIAKIKQSVSVPCETIEMGVFKMKWPDRAA
ncbi:MAG: hypothetical protein H6Q89_4190 [Myxococcaceae bacterium]|nr:hypothetical protein [Myxococcaceae bacterium]